MIVSAAWVMLYRTQCIIACICMYCLFSKPNNFYNYVLQLKTLLRPTYTNNKPIRDQLLRKPSICTIYNKK